VAAVTAACVVRAGMSARLTVNLRAIQNACGTLAGTHGMGYPTVALGTLPHQVLW